MAVEPRNRFSKHDQIREKIEKCPGGTATGPPRNVFAPERRGATHKFPQCVEVLDDLLSMCMYIHVLSAQNLHIHTTGQI